MSCSGMMKFAVDDDKETHLKDTVNVAYENDCHIERRQVSVHSTVVLHIRTREITIKRCTYTKVLN